MNVTITCAQCEKEFDVEVTFGRPGRYSGPPEYCYPDEDDEIEPGKCPNCNTEIDPAEAFEKASDAVADGRGE